MCWLKYVCCLSWTYRYDFYAFSSSAEPFVTSLNQICNCTCMVIHVSSSNIYQTAWINLHIHGGMQYKMLNIHLSRCCNITALTLPVIYDFIYYYTVQCNYYGIQTVRYTNKVKDVIFVDFMVVLKYKLCYLQFFRD